MSNVCGLLWAIFRISLQCLSFVDPKCVCERENECL